LALHRVRLELARLGHYALDMAREALPIVFHGSLVELEALAQMDDDVDTLHGAIVTYLSQLSRRKLTEAQSQRLSEYMAIANDLENIGDMIQTNLVEAGTERLKYNVEMSLATQKVLGELHQEVCWAVEHAVTALVQADEKEARAVRAVKPEINYLAEEANKHLARRLAADEPNRLATFKVESEIIEYLKRVYYFAKRIARITAQMELNHLELELSRPAEEVVLT
jgi:phosphate:Na+ symporter